MSQSERTAGYLLYDDVSITRLRSVVCLDNKLQSVWWEAVLG